MSDAAVVTDEQIRDFLRWTIEIAPTMYVDDEGYPHRKEAGDYCYIGNDTETKVKRPVVLYGSVIKDQEAIIINPFVEGMTKSPGNTWYYTLITLNVSNYVRMIQKCLLTLALESKDKKKEDSNDMELASILAPFVDKVDETMLKEFDTLTKKMSTYFNIYYLPRKREARVSCGLINNDDLKIANKKIRTKTWEVLTKMLLSIFETKDFSEYTITSKMQGCPEFDAILRLMFKLFAMMNKYMPYLVKIAGDDFKYQDFDLDYMEKNIDLLNVFRMKAKYMVPVESKSAPDPKTAAVNNPIAGIQPTGFCLPGSSQPMMPQMPAMAPVGATQMNMQMQAFQQQPLVPMGAPFQQQPVQMGMPNTGMGMGMMNQMGNVNPIMGAPFSHHSPAASTNLAV